MFKNDTSGVVRSTLFDSVSGLIHGFSIRSHGDMRNVQVRNTFLSMLGLNNCELYWKFQMHTSRVNTITYSTNILKLPDADAAIVIPQKDAIRNIALTVRFADCVPILVVSPKEKIIAVIHAGWKGTVGHITRRVIDTIIESGVHPSTIFAAIGAHIGPCCYDVTEKRAGQFLSAFDSDRRVAWQKKSRWYVDLGYANKKELTECGIKEEHIDMDVRCTSCNNNKTFSYRKDTKETYGVMMGVLAWK